MLLKSEAASKAPILCWCPCRSGRTTPGHPRNGTMSQKAWTLHQAQCGEPPHFILTATLQADMSVLCINQGRVPRDAKPPAQSHTDSKGRSRYLNSGLSAPELCFFFFPPHGNQSDLKTKARLGHSLKALVTSSHSTSTGPAPPDSACLSGHLPYIWLSLPTGLPVPRNR